MRYLLLLLCICSQPVLAFQNQQQLDQFAAKTRLMFAVKSNFGANQNAFSGEIALHNDSKQALPKGEAPWRIYFHSIRKINTTLSAGLEISHIQGDLHQIKASKDFAGLAAGQSIRLEFSSAPWIVSYSDWMPRAFISSGKLKPAIFANTNTEDFSAFVEASTRPEQLLRFDQPSQDLYPVATAESRFAQNQHQQSSKKQNARWSVIPTPQQREDDDESITLGAGWQLFHQGRLKQEAVYLQQQLKAQFGLDLPLTSQPGPRQIQLVTSEDLPQAESYRLTAQPNQILLAGTDNAGGFYAVQTLLALLEKQGDSIQLPQTKISDWPRYRWRGMHYDMARNFHGKAVTLRLIEQMARYKLNKLHLHLTEDEGWRLEIPGLPELTDIGGSRCFDLTEQQCLLTQLGTGPDKSGSGNGYYSTADFIEILKYAAERHIEVIPEIDMPGHARAAVKAMQARYTKLKAKGQLEQAKQFLLSDPADQSVYLTVQNYNDNSVNVCLPSAYAFADKVLYELQQMYRQAGVRLNTFHMGGDEVGAGSWTASPACAALIAEADNGVSGVADLKPYFVSKVAMLAANRQLALGGWEDGLMYDAKTPFNRAQFANPAVIANVWDNIWEWGVADRAYRLANAGYQVVLSHGTHLYFDHPYEAHPDERGYYWAARFTDLAKVFGYMPDHLYANADKTREGQPIYDLEALLGRELPKLEQPDNILGIQGQIWSETIRTAEQLEQLLYPRLLALAERAWYQAEWESDEPDTAARNADYQRFSLALVQQELPRLHAAGVALYLPPPGAVRQNGLLLANSAWDGLTIEYSTDNGQSWQPYQEAVSVPAGPVQLRTSAQGRQSRVTQLD